MEYLLDPVLLLEVWLGDTNNLWQYCHNFERPFLNDFHYVHGVQPLIQFLSPRKLVTWRICMSFHFWSSWISLRNHDHVSSNCSKNHFWSTLKLFELDQKCFFEHLMITWNQFVRKKHFWSSLNNFSISLKSHDHDFEEKFSWIKSEAVCICVTWLIF